MLAVAAKLSDTAVDGLPGVSATVWSVGVPVQSSVVSRWKTTFPLGAATASACASGARQTDEREGKRQ